MKKALCKSFFLGGASVIFLLEAVDAFGYTAPIADITVNNHPFGDPSFFGCVSSSSSTTVTTTTNFVTVFGSYTAGSTVISLSSQNTGSTTSTTFPPISFSTAGSYTLSITASKVGSGTSTATIPYDVWPTIGSLGLPAASLFFPGATLTITGTGFQAPDGTLDATVKLGGTVWSGCSIDSDTTITCNVPVGTASGNYQVTVSNPCNPTGQTATFSVSAPSLSITTPFSPASPQCDTASPSPSVVVTVTGATSVELQKNDVIEGSAVTFSPGTGTNTVPFTVSSSLTVAGSYNLKVVASNSVDSVSLNTLYVVLPAPSLDAPSPISSAGGSITLTGTDFDSPSSVTFDPGSYPCSITSSTATQIICTAPALPASVDTVTVTDTCDSSLSQSITVTDDDIITVSLDVDPLSPVCDSDTVDLTATTTTTLATSVELKKDGVTDGLPADFPFSASESTATFTTSLTTPGAYVLTAVATNSFGRSVTSDAVNYFLAPGAPSISSVSDVPSAGGSVTITGLNLVDPTSIVFDPGSHSCSSISVNPAQTQITCTAPAMSPPVNSVTITNPCGSDTYSPAALAAPTFSPSQGCSDDTNSPTLTVSGAPANSRVDFYEGTGTTSLGNDDIPATPRDATFDVPSLVAGEYTFKATVTENGLTSAFSPSSSTFTVYPSTTVTSSTPASGPTAGGTTLRIAGTGFDAFTNAGLTPSLKFDTGASCGNVAINAGGTEITCVTPALPAGAHSLTLACGGSTPLTFTATAPNPPDPPTKPSAPAAPILSAVQGCRGDAGPGLKVEGVPAGSTVSFYEGSTKLGSATASSGGDAVLNVPALPEGSHSFKATVTVSDQTSDYSALSAAYEVLAKQVLTGVTPAEGPLTASVTLKGSNFNARPLTVQGCESVKVESDSQATCAIKASAAGDVPISLAGICAEGQASYHAISNPPPQIDNNLPLTTQQATQQAVRSAFDFLGLRQEEEVEKAFGDGISSGVSTGDQRNPGLRKPRAEFWCRAVNNYGDQGFYRGVEGFSLHSSGINIGFDTYIGSRVKVGVAVNYQGSQLDLKNSGSSHADVNSYLASLYFFSPLKHRWFVSGIVGMGQHHYKTLRDTQGQGFARAIFDTRQYSGEATVGYRVRWKQLVFMPSLKGHFTLLRQPEYIEQGSPGSVHVGKARNVVAQGKLNLKVMQKTRDEKACKLVPYINLAAGYNSSKVAAVDLSLGDQIVLLPERHQPKVFGEVGAGFMLAAADKIRLDCSYTAKFTTQYFGHTVMLKGVYKF